MTPKEELKIPVTGTRRPCHRRDGIGTLALVLLFVLVIGVMQLGQRFFVGQVTDQAARTSIGRAAQTIARSAITEGMARVASQVNAQGSKLYTILRDDLPIRNATRAITIGSTFPQHTPNSPKIILIYPLLLLAPQGCARIAAGLRSRSFRQAQ